MSKLVITMLANKMILRQIFLMHQATSCRHLHTAGKAAAAAVCNLQSECHPITPQFLSCLAWRRRTLSPCAILLVDPGDYPPMARTSRHYLADPRDPITPDVTYQGRHQVNTGPRRRKHQDAVPLHCRKTHGNGRSDSTEYHTKYPDKYLVF